MLYRRGHAVSRARIGVGTAGWPTPRGTFYVRQRLTRFADPFYGPVAFGLSARSGGAHRLAWRRLRRDPRHEPAELLPGRVSHGCIRLRNEDVLRLAALMPLGTPVTIV